MWSIIFDAGWPIWPLILTSIFALGIIFERIWAMRIQSVAPADLLETVIEHLTRANPVRLNENLKQDSLLGMILTAGLNCQPRDNTHLKEAFEYAGGKAAQALEKNLSLLSMVVTVAPLMGLLGTVVGMIEVFGSQSSLGADPVALAHGISVALYNTAFGLIIAIPAAIAHRYLRITAQKHLSTLEDAARILQDKLLQTSHTNSAK